MKANKPGNHAQRTQLTHAWVQQLELLHSGGELEQAHLALSAGLHERCGPCVY